MLIVFAAICPNFLVLAASLAVIDTEAIQGVLDEVGFGNFTEAEAAGAAELCEPEQVEFALDSCFGEVTGVLGNGVFMYIPRRLLS